MRCAGATRPSTSRAQRARQLGLDGAAFPWRTIRGHECSGYWPAGTAAFHIGADIADAVIRYQAATGDEAFERDVGVELLVETARFWRSLGHHDPQGGFRIDGVTGPGRVQRGRRQQRLHEPAGAAEPLAAADAVARHPAARSGARRRLRGGRRRGATRARTWSSRGTTTSASTRSPKASRATSCWDFERTAPDQYPLLLHYPYFDLYRKQVVKQADLVLALHVSRRRVHG